MTSIGRITSYLNLKNLAFTAEDTNYTKLGKIVAGLGVAGLALLSWKIIFAGALGYSGYKGTEYIQNKFWRRHEVRRNPEPVPEEEVPEEEVPEEEVPEEEVPEEPVAAAHADREEQRDDPIPQLRQMQHGANPHGKRALELIITHPKIQEKGSNIQWVRKLIRTHGKWSKWTLGLSLPAVLAFRKIKACVPKKEVQENPIDLANQ